MNRRYLPTVDGPNTTMRTEDAVLPLSMPFPELPMRGGVRGRPWIWVQLLQSGGKPAGSQALPDRRVQLVQLAPGN
jgi:hypothetical protein